MVYFCNFSAPIPESAARERITAFFERSGYKLMGGDGGRLLFKRGSLLGTYSNTNPSAWAGEAVVSVIQEANQSGIKVELSITSDPFERRFAAALAAGELSLLEAAVVNNDAAVFNVIDLRKRISANLYRVIGVLAGIIIAAFLGALAGMLFFYVAELSPALSVAGGAGIFLVLGIICLAVFERKVRERS